MARLRDICQELADQGAHNLNFVNPTHYAHTLRELLENWRPFPWFGTPEGMTRWIHSVP